MIVTDAYPSVRNKEPLVNRTVIFAATFAAALLAFAAPVRAQGAFAQALVGAGVAEGQTATAVSGSIGYRFNRVFGLGVEATHLMGLEAGPRADRLDRIADLDSAATMFTTNVRVEIPTLSRRVIPYVVGGGGVARVQTDIELDIPDARLQNRPTGPAFDLRAPFGRPGPDRFRAGGTSMVFTIGGGTSILLTDRLAIDADLRLQALLGGRDRNIGRFSVGASYRF